MISSESKDEPNPIRMTLTPTIIDCIIFNIKRVCLLTFFLKVKLFSSYCNLTFTLGMIIVGMSTT